MSGMQHRSRQWQGLTPKGKNRKEEEAGKEKLLPVLLQVGRQLGRTQKYEKYEKFRSMEAENETDHR